MNSSAGCPGARDCGSRPRPPWPSAPCYSGSPTCGRVACTWSSPSLAGDRVRGRLPSDRAPGDGDPYPLRDKRHPFPALYLPRPGVTALFGTNLCGTLIAELTLPGSHGEEPFPEPAQPRVSRRRRRDGRAHARAGLVAHAARPGRGVAAEPAQHRRACCCRRRRRSSSSGARSSSSSTTTPTVRSSAPSIRTRWAVPGREAWSEIWDSVLHDAARRRRPHRRGVLGARICCSSSSATGSSRRPTSTSRTIRCASSPARSAACSASSPKRPSAWSASGGMALLKDLADAQCHRAHRRATPACSRPRRSPRSRRTSRSRSRIWTTSSRAARRAREEQLAAREARAGQGARRSSSVRRPAVPAGG